MTGRILLRSLGSEDVTPVYVSWLNDPEVFRYLGIRHRRRPFTEEDIRSFLEDCMARCRFHWGIFLDSRHVGNVSCSEWSNENRWIDISYIIGDKEVWGRGVATLSVGAAISNLFSVHHYHRVQAHAVVENLASIRVMAKLGMRRDALFRESAYFPQENRFIDEVIYSVLQWEWNPRIAGFDKVKIYPMPWEQKDSH